VEWFWTWDGKSVGYRYRRCLFRYDGLQIGLFDGDEIYGADSAYLGEVINGDRLIRKLSKTAQHRSAYAPEHGAGFTRYADHAAHLMLAGYEDFPDPASFREEAGARPD
jgi:hypothetical protein